MPHASGCRWIRVRRDGRSPRRSCFRWHP
jgi:hypothetical protein